VIFGESFTTLTATVALKSVAVFPELFAFGTAIVTGHGLPFPRSKPIMIFASAFAAYPAIADFAVPSVDADGTVFLFTAKRIGPTYIATTNLTLFCKPLKTGVDERQRILYSIERVSPALKRIPYLDSSHGLFPSTVIDHCLDEIRPRDFVTDMSALNRLGALEELSVDGKQIPSLVSLSKLPSLNKLSIIAQVPVDMTAVGSLSNLKVLSIWGPPVIDMSPLRQLHHLLTLQASGLGFAAGRSRVIDADAIGTLPQLRTLTLTELQIDSLGFLTKLNNLVELNLSNLPVVSVSDSANLQSLKQISLVSIPVVDISPFLSLSNLQKLSLLRTPARADVISELERRGTTVSIN
jgi:hypothetical protein